VDNDNRDLNGYQPAGPKTHIYQNDDGEQFSGLEDVDMDDIDYGKTLLSELDRIERELKSLD
jgi:hypothetical protein